MFSPYHRFSNCLKLERTIKNLKDANSVPQFILGGHNRYHYALLHKLRCAYNHIKQLEKTLKDTPPEEVIGDLKGFVFTVNATIDGFFYSSGSALDILAREVLTYFNITMPRLVYFQTAHQQLTQQRPADPLIDRFQNPSWKDEFSTYRNALTHELLIAERYTIHVEMDGATERTRIVFPLPDDPKLEPERRTFRKNPDVIIYCTHTFRRLLSLINTIYGDLSDKIISSSTLPI